MFRRIVAGAVFAGLLGLAAVNARAGDRVPTSDEIAAARVEADAIISWTGAPDLFENVTTGSEAAIRHRPSNLVCSFHLGQWRGQISIGQGAARADEVSCSALEAGGISWVLAQRAVIEWRDADQRARGTIDGMAILLKRQPAIERITAPIGKSLPTGTVAYRFQDLTGAEPVYVWVGAVDLEDWKVTSRILSTGDANPTSQTRSAHMMLIQIRGEVSLLLADHYISGKPPSR